MPNAVFRADASHLLGIGHVMRCLTFADILKSTGWHCEFICKLHRGHLKDYIEQRGFDCNLLPVDVSDDLLGGSWQADAELTVEVLTSTICDLLILDHYFLSTAWSNTLRSSVDKILVIDDLADREHDCDCLLDQTYERQAAAYTDLTPKGCRLLLGSEYALLRPQFSGLRDKAIAQRKKQQNPHRILVSFGGSDADNVTGLALRAIKSLPYFGDLTITVVLGKNNIFAQEIKNQLRTLGTSTRLLIDVADMAQEMLDHDIAIGAAGTTAWERCCLGLPCITLEIAENQRFVAKSLSDSGAINFLGNFRDISHESIADAITAWVEDVSRWRHSVACSLSVCDGLGAHRVALSVLSTASGRGVVLRLADSGDMALIYDWQATPGVRTYSRNPDIPSYSEHQTWYKAMLKNSQCFLWIAEHAKTPLGFIRVNIMPEDLSVMEISIVTSPAFQKLGIGAWMLEAMKSQYADCTLMGEVSAANLASVKLFQSTGFVEREPGKFYWVHD